MFAIVKSIISSIFIQVFGLRGRFREIYRNTAMVEPCAIPLDICEKLIGKIEAILSQPEYPRVWKDSTESDSRILGFEKDIDGLTKLLSISEKIDCIDSYTGQKTKSWFLMANRLVPRLNNLGSGGGMHRDSPFSHQVKCIWYLNDVFEDNGPFQYIPFTNINSLANRKKYPLGQSRFEEVYETPVEVHADAGTLIICDTKCIHSGKPIQSGVRYAVTLYTLPKVGGLEKMLKSLGISQKGI